MSVPFWFDSKAYVKNKAADMNIDAAELLQLFKNAGFGTDADGLYSHFTQFGNAETISPNAFFNTGQYLYTKAASFYGVGSVTDQQSKSMDLAMNQAGMSPWVHFQNFWAEDFATKGTFHNPSAVFDVAAYMADKLTKMQADPAFGPTYTMAQLVKAFQDAGLDPVSHYIVAGADEGLAPKSIGTGTPGATYQLTGGDDEIFATRGDDFINAKVDTLDDNDYIDGGAGIDTLYANVKNDNFGAIAPEVTNVENVIFRAQVTTTEGGGDNNSDAYIDAGNITGMKLLGNDNSRASLTVEDVRTDSNQMTIRMSNTDPGKVDFGVYFDPQHLKAVGGTTSGTLNVQVMDVKNAQINSDPLTENPFDSFKFNNDGTLVTLTFRAADKALFSGPTATYDTLLQAFQHALEDYEAANPSMAGLFSITKGSSFSGTSTVGGTTFQSDMGYNMLINSSQGTVDATSTGTGWGVSTGTVPAVGGIVWGVYDASSTTCPLIQTNVELDNVGRVQWDDASACLPDNSIYGSEAGDLVIGSMPGRGGVERFDVTVDRGSWLSSMSSTNNALRMVTVKNGDVNGNVKDNNNGNLFIGDSVHANDIKAGTSTELDHWMNVPRLLTTEGLVDVKFFDASEMVGKVNVGASLTAASYEKYLRDVDGVDNMITDAYAPDGPFAYNLGHNSDTLNMKVEGGIAADQDFILNISAGDGNDLVNYVTEFKTVNQHLNQVALRNVNIDLGAGNDDLWTWGTILGNYAGAVNVLGGAGNDAVYLGQNDTATDQNAVWVFNFDALAQTIIDPSGTQGAQPLNNDVLGTSGEFIYSGTVGHTLQVTVNFKGISVVVDVATIGALTGNKVSAQTINEAIAEAINENPVLSKLLVAKDGAGYSLLVESIIDGEMLVDDLGVTFQTRNALGVTAPVTWTTGNASTQYDTTANTNAGFAKIGGADVDGTDTGTIAVNHVDGGAGNDVITLGADAGLAVSNFDTVHLSGSSIGNDYVMNFTTAVDKFDVSSYATPAAPIANAANVSQAAALGANVGTTPPTSWATLLSTLSTVQAAQGNNVIFVENTSTLGISDYYVFQVQHTGGAGNVAAADTVTLLGTVTTPDGIINDGDIKAA